VVVPICHSKSFENEVNRALTALTCRVRGAVHSITCGLMHRSKTAIYSITSSAMASIEGGIVRPSIRAVSALMTSSSLVD
jgi:hypothetical protein